MGHGSKEATKTNFEDIFLVCWVNRKHHHHTIRVLWQQQCQLVCEAQGSKAKLTYDRVEWVSKTTYNPLDPLGKFPGNFGHVPRVHLKLEFVQSSPALFNLKQTLELKD